MASFAIRFFFIVLAIAVAGCDQVAQLGALVGLAPKREVVRRESKTPAPRPQVSPTPRPTAAPRWTPQPDPNVAPVTPTPVPSGTTFPATPIPVPSAVTPWLSAKGYDVGNGGVIGWDLASGGFGLSRQGIDRELVYSKDGGIAGGERHTVVAINQLDGYVYWLVYRYWLWYPAGKCNSFPEVRGERGVFRLENVNETTRVASFTFVATQSVNPSENEMGFTNSEDGGCAGYGNGLVGWRAYALNQAWSVLPGTPSPDVVAIATDSLRLSEQAEARWGADTLPSAGLPPAPKDWSTDYSPKRPGINIFEGLGSVLQHAHAVGGRVALANRASYYEHPEEGVFRLTNGDNTWRPIAGLPKDEFVWHTYYDLAYSDLYGGPTFWIRVGGFAGTVYSVSEADAAKLP